MKFYKQSFKVVYGDVASWNNTPIVNRFFDYSDVMRIESIYPGSPKSKWRCVHLRFRGNDNLVKVILSTKELCKLIKRLTK
jgi:hypothetical protein